MIRLTVPRYDDPRNFTVARREPSGRDSEYVTLAAPCGCTCIAVRHRTPSAGYSSGQLTECAAHSQS